MTAAAFKGFPRECFQFLTDLAANNNRDWFHEHKPEYKTYVACLVSHLNFLSILISSIPSKVRLAVKKF